MTERFNGRINELVKQTYFANAAELETTLQHYLKLYNHHIPQRAIGSKTPIESLKHWQGLRPELFVKRVYDQAGLDMYQASELPSNEVSTKHLSQQCHACISYQYTIHLLDDQKL